MAHQLLLQQMVYIDEHLRQGALVYIESLLVEHHIPRSHYLTLDDLGGAYPFLRLTSRVPIDFFTPVLPSECDDENFQPIELNLCTVTQRPGLKPVHHWQRVNSFRCIYVLEALHCLLETLSNPAYFQRCRICQRVFAAGHLDAGQICGHCMVAKSV
ncbi:hypothetical protein [Photobacterium atrarenae]|uniref:Uncharacterized protein n=1 Tax=Photobacterium atrarenae TaxID=865757 RepID=A0ABY5GBI6_9GAMM|nr:hypothetical protein [Photobacterium atrarenae]UTV26542.1 hypothetical protein NNL38_09160 [Photobacterium atrarenae]